MTCTDDTADRNWSADCTGFHGLPFHDPFHGPAVDRHCRPQDQEQAAAGPPRGGTTPIPYLRLTGAPPFTSHR